MLRYIVLILFVCGMIATGFLVRKKIKNENDFMLGGGKLGGWMSAFAYGTTYFSAVVFIGYGGSVSWQYMDRHRQRPYRHAGRMASAGQAHIPRNACRKRQNHAGIF